MRRASFIVVLGVGFGLLAWGQTIEDPLHGCIIGTSCFDNGTVTPTSTNPLPPFTFSVSPVTSANNPGDLLVDILVPDDVFGSASENYTINGAPALLKGEWNTGGLPDFLGLSLASGSPKNDITAWLPYVKANGDPNAMGFQVYQADLGNELLQGPGMPTGPVLNLGGTSSLPIASLLVGFLGNGSTFGTSTNFVSTANSGAIFEADDPKGTVPEPASFLLFGTLAVLTVTILKKTSRQN